MRRTFGIPAALALALLGAAGCASAPGRAVPVAATYEDLPYNLTDVLFCREMTLHYQQANTLAGLVGGRSRDPYVTGLAAAVVRAGTRETVTMAASLKEWNFRPPDPGKPPVHQMEGMLSEAQLLVLKGKSGPDFDRLWLTTLARHDYYGVLLARKAQAEGKDAATRRLAGEIAVAQKSQMDDVITHLR
ncbi:DUF305 domain-containing protein [Sphaerisporangium fuscum]|uniref:DUF305 domain-containing protein n=1 Tax=Sphaerisporangium fuscum TaxID=2835868 RepID=UPI001BDBCAFA|nr:DUF305 domain-containing protein [Sphaerisporangium fuscum]